MAVTLITKSAYARHRGCDEKAVRKAVTEGRISLIDGKIDPAVADIQWAQNTRARAAQVVAPSADRELPLDAPAEVPEASTQRAVQEPGYMAFRSRREEADAQIAEMNAAKMRGTMVMRQDVDRAFFEIGREVRDRLAACARRIASEVAATSSAEACESIVDREHRIVLELLVTSMREKLGAPAKASA